jgi:GNAT superfamily N-acetyltransferase
MLTAQVEPWAEFVEEARPLFPEHWRELALNQDKVPLDPRYEIYDAHDAKGGLLVVTLRGAGELAGYFIGFVAPGLHYRSCLTLTMDIFWVRPEHRGGALAGIKLFRAVEAEARRRGVRRLFYGSKVHKDASRLFEFLRCEPVETFYTKWIGD